MIGKAKEAVAKRESETPAYAVYVESASDGEDESCFTCSIHDPYLCPWPESRFDDKFSERFLRGCKCKNFRPAIELYRIYQE